MRDHQYSYIKSIIILSSILLLSYNHDVSSFMMPTQPVRSHISIRPNLYQNLSRYIDGRYGFISTKYKNVSIAKGGTSYEASFHVNINVDDNNHVSEKSHDDEIIQIHPLPSKQDPMTDCDCDLKYDLSSPREWMEYLHTEEGLFGPYTVLRCDFDCNNQASDYHNYDISSINDLFYIWGKEYHLQRLLDSYKMMFQGELHNKFNHTSTETNNNTLDKQLSDAIIKSDEIIQALIKEYFQVALSGIVEKNGILSIEEINRDLPINSQSRQFSRTKTIMITILWTPYITKKNPNKGIVRGHLFCNDNPAFPRLYNPQPIVASIAVTNSQLSTAIPIGDIGGNQTSINNGSKSTDLLPSRYCESPQAKISSWCTKRKPIEEIFKSKNIGEVFLIYQDDNDDTLLTKVNLLEGLTSNIFVVYKDGTIRTQLRKGVLQGYAQSLLVDAAKMCNMTVYQSSSDLSNSKGENNQEDFILPLQDCIDGLWAEVFISSSIRICTPVKSIVISNNHNHGMEKNDVVKSPADFVEIWKQCSLGKNEVPWSERRWKVLYNKVLDQTLLQKKQ